MFVYGTLLIPAVMKAVTGQLFEHQPASLPGYARYIIKGQVFPGIIAAQDKSVDGMIYNAIDEMILQRLDAFESDVYERKKVLVTLENNQQVPAYTYVISRQHEYLLTDKSWDLEVFNRKHLADYLNRI